ncbi:apoptosis-associated speck-like protein containing a CARD [Symphorus nematophorus]
MPPKTARRVLADALEDLDKQDFDKFCRALLDRKEEPRVRRNKVQGKSFLDVADVLVSTFTETKAIGVAVDLLRQIDCNQDATSLLEEFDGPVSGGTAGPPAGAGAANTAAVGKHFVDEHQLDLINRVTNISPILDELLSRKVIQQESYDKIRALSVSQDKMRELYSGCLRASRLCKDVFYEILEKNEPFLIAELKGE